MKEEKPLYERAVKYAESKFDCLDVRADLHTKADNLETVIQQLFEMIGVYREAYYEERKRRLKLKKKPRVMP